MEGDKSLHMANIYKCQARIDLGLWKFDLCYKNLEKGQLLKKELIAENEELRLFNFHTTKLEILLSIRSPETLAWAEKLNNDIEHTLAKYT